MSVSVTLRDWLKGKITSLDSVQKVYGYEPEKLTQFPAVTITLPEIQGAFSSNSENSRLFSYMIRVYFPFNSDVSPPDPNMPREEYAEGVVATVMEQIIDILDDNFIIAGADLPSDYTVKYANAANLLPFYVQSDTGWLRGCEITLSVYAEKTVV